MTPVQIELARHALGLGNGRTVSYRNNFVAGPGHDDFGEWERMVAAGYARKGPAEKIFAGDHVFRLTRAGAEAALKEGERLSSDDWR